MNRYNLQWSIPRFVISIIFYSNHVPSQSITPVPCHKIIRGRKKTQRHGEKTANHAVHKPTIKNAPSCVKPLYEGCHTPCPVEGLAADGSSKLKSKRYEREITDRWAAHN